MRLPQFRELLEIADDGSFAMWRSVSMASLPPSPIGRFAGRLGDDDRRELADAARAAAGEGPRTWLIAPDSPLDVVEVDGVSATLGIHDAGEGAWQAFVALVRPLLGDLTGAPLAAIALEVDEVAFLVHRGTEPLRLDLSSLAVHVDHWRDGESEGRWTAPAEARGEVVADVGWRLSLPFDHGFDVRAGDRLAVKAGFAAYDGDRLIPTSLQTT